MSGYKSRSSSISCNSTYTSFKSCEDIDLQSEHLPSIKHSSMNVISYPFIYDEVTSAKNQNKRCLKKHLCSFRTNYSSYHIKYIRFQNHQIYFILIRKVGNIMAKKLSYNSIRRVLLCEYKQLCIIKHHLVKVPFINDESISLFNETNFVIGCNRLLIISNYKIRKNQEAKKYKIKSILQHLLKKNTVESCLQTNNSNSRKEEVRNFSTTEIKESHEQISQEKLPTDTDNMQKTAATKQPVFSEEIDERIKCDNSHEILLSDTNTIKNTTPLNPTESDFLNKSDSELAMEKIITTLDNLLGNSSNSISQNKYLNLDNDSTLKQKKTEAFVNPSNNHLHYLSHDSDISSNEHNSQPILSSSNISKSDELILEQLSNGYSSNNNTIAENLISENFQDTHIDYQYSQENIHKLLHPHQSTEYNHISVITDDSSKYLDFEKNVYNKEDFYSDCVEANVLLENNETDDKSECEPRPAAKVPENQLENIDRITIYVLHKNVLTPVTWSKDISAEDISELIYSACDSITATESSSYVGFTLYELHQTQDETQNYIILNKKKNYFYYGREYSYNEFDQLKLNKIYALTKSEHRNFIDASCYIGKNLQEPIEPLEHDESDRALKFISKGTNLLLHTILSSPQMRYFQLSYDFQRLLWYSLDVRSCHLEIKNIEAIFIGKESKFFRQYKRSSSHHLSFSIVCKKRIGYPLMNPLNVFGALKHASKTLHLTCKNEYEFDAWVTGLKALIYAEHNIKISKYALLNHCKFIKQLVHQRINFKTMFTKSLHDYLDLPKQNRVQLMSRMKVLKTYFEHLKKNIVKFSNEYTDRKEIVELLEIFSHYNISNKSILRDRINDLYKSLTDASSRVIPQWEFEDNLLEFQTMHYLCQTVASSIHDIEDRFKNHKALNFVDYKEINFTLWYAEINFENIRDMLTRLMRRRNVAKSDIHKLLSKISIIFNDVLIKSK